MLRLVEIDPTYKLNNMFDVKFCVCLIVVAVSILVDSDICIWCINQTIQTLNYSLSAIWYCESWDWNWYWSMSWELKSSRTVSNVSSQNIAAIDLIIEIAKEDVDFFFLVVKVLGIGLPLSCAGIAW